MHHVGVQVAMERAQRRWVLGAMLLALLFHVFLAYALGWYKIAALEVPFHHTAPTGPFTLKRVEINPEALKPDQTDPISRLPTIETTKNPAQFDLDPTQVVKALQTPQPSLSAPSVPEPNRVVAASDLNQGLPYVQSDSAKITAEITKTDPTTSSGPLVSAKLAQELISSNTGYPQPGQAVGAPPSGNGAGTLPGFKELAPGFKTAGAALAHLPEPVLLRLPSDVLFDFDSAKLKPEAGSLLSQAVGLVTKYPQADVQIDGYSDSFGRPDYNLNLSQQRAASVQAWLQDRVPQTGYKFRALGHGSANYLVSPQSSIDQQQPNRRVEILIQALKL